MNTTSADGWSQTPLQTEATHPRFLARKLRSVKVCFGLLLGICFWFSVPYHFPLELDNDPVKAAASEAASYQGNVSRQLAMPVVLLLSALALYYLPKLRGLAKPSKLLLVAAAYGAWALASVTWSDDPAISTKRLFVFGVDAFFAVVLARVTTAVETALFGFLCTGAVAALAFVADAFLLHSFAPADPDYRFMGVMTANYQAMNLVVCLVCGLTLLQRFPRWKVWLTPLLSAFSGLLFLTRARIGTLLFLAAGAFVLVRMARERLQPHARAMVLTLTCMFLLPAATYVVARSGSAAVSSAFMMGRQDSESTASLSNRAPLWGELTHYASDHWLLGYGFEAFWSAERVERVSLSQGWVVPHAHNTYLDQALSLGLPGAFLYGAMLLGACGVAWTRYSRHRNESTLLPALLLSWLALLGMTESIPLAPCLPVLIAYSCIVRMWMEPEIELEQTSSAAYTAAWHLPPSAAVLNAAGAGR